MTKTQIENLNLGIAPIDARAEIVINSGIDWLSENTTIDTADINNIPNCAKLFLIKFFDLQMLSVGVTSESIEGLSQSFDTSDKSALLWQIAEELLGNYLKGRVRFVPSTNRWR